MAKPSLGHIIKVRRQSFIPTYFSVCESQLSWKCEDCEYELQQAADSEVSGARFYWLRSETFSSQNQLFTTAYLTMPLTKTTEDSEQSGTTLTTRLLSSGLAKRFSCNVSKMAYRVRNRTVCDGYYGCPDEKFCTGKVHATSLKKGKPVCILPWKKRKIPSKAKNPKKAMRSSKGSEKESDGFTSLLEKTKVTSNNTKGHVIKDQQGNGTKSHPAMFYSYYIAKGNAVQYRQICAPKRRPCDGFYGCYDEGSIRGKKAGKRKLINKY